MTTSEPTWRTRLLGFRQKRGWTQAQMGKFVGCSQQLVNAMENGHRVPGPKLAKRIDARTDGYVSRLAMRPDVFGLDIDDEAA